jgi:hypothetical protein
MKLTFCALCGDTDNLEHHHLLPKSLGGTNKKDNILTLCSKHHVAIHELSDSRINSGNLIKEAKKKQKEQGLFLGGRNPFGYTNLDGILVPNKKEKAILDDLINRRKNGVSYRELSVYLKEKYGIEKTFMGVKYIINRGSH